MITDFCHREGPKFLNYFNIYTSDKSVTSKTEIVYDEFMFHQPGGLSMEYTHITHPFPPLYDATSRILILGSLPSIKSREQMFFYGHPQNRFWPMLATVLGEPIPKAIEEKRQLALLHHIAMWDTIYSCDIKGSSDASIRDVVPTDLKPIIEGSRITQVFCNGKTSGNYYKKYQQQILGIEPIVLPSTSPANAAWKMDRLVEAWSVIREYL